MITVKEEFLGDSKTLRAVKLGGSEAVVLWLAMKAYAAKHLTDGFVADDEVESLCTGLLDPERARLALKALVECGRTQRDGTRGAGLVDPAPNGWQLHDYLDHDDSRARVLERRNLARARKARHEVKNAPGTHSERIPERDQNASGTHSGTRPERGENAPRARGRADVPPLLSSPQEDPLRDDHSKDLSGRARGQADQPSSSSARIPCPADLTLLPAQLEQLAGPGCEVPDWAIQRIAADWLAANALRDDTPRTLQQWRATLAKVVLAIWRDSERRPKRDDEGDTARKRAEANARLAAMQAEDEAHRAAVLAEQQREGGVKAPRAGAEQAARLRALTGGGA